MSDQTLIMNYEDTDLYKRMQEIQIEPQTLKLTLSDYIHWASDEVYRQYGRNPRSLIMSEESYNELMGYIAKGNDYSYRPTNTPFDRYPSFQAYFHAYTTGHKRIQFQGMNLIPVLLPGAVVIVG